MAGGHHEGKQVQVEAGRGQALPCGRKTSSAGKEPSLTASPDTQAKNKLKDPPGPPWKSRISRHLTLKARSRRRLCKTRPVWLQATVLGLGKHLSARLVPRAWQNPGQRGVRMQLWGPNSPCTSNPEGWQTGWDWPVLSHHNPGCPQPPPRGPHLRPIARGHHA